MLGHDPDVTDAVDLIFDVVIIRFRNDGYASNPEPRPIASPARRIRCPSLGHEHVERVPSRTLPHGVGQRRRAPNFGGRYGELHVRIRRPRRSEKQSPTLGSLRGVLRALQGSELALKHRRRAVLFTRASGVATTSGDPDRAQARHVRQYRPDFHPSLGERRSEFTVFLRLRERGCDAVDVSTGPEGGPASPWPQSAASKNSDKWGNFVSFGYLFISAVIMNNILYTFFPNGLGAAMVKPAALKITELMIAFSCAVLAACDFGPQAAKQVRGGLRALDQVGGNRATPIRGDYIMAFALPE